MSDENRQLQEQQARRGLLLRRAIEREVSGLIKAGTGAVQKLGAQSGNHKRLEESQMRNLLNVATETSSIDVVTNFIRYQIGRMPEEWGTQDKPDRQDKDFGPTLIHDIETGAVRQATVRVRQSLEGQSAEGEGSDFNQEQLQDAFNSAYIQLTRLYLGYANRAFYYARKREKEDGREVWNKLYRVAVEGEDHAV